jgi:hypothetical protein
MQGRFGEFGLLIELKIFPTSEAVSTRYSITSSVFL